MRQSGETGSVMVEFEVDTLGRVIRAVAVRYTHREFVDPAVRAVLRWHFEPGKRHGKTVPFRMAVPIEFGLSAN
jgi:TonB family protein